MTTEQVFWICVTILAGCLWICCTIAQAATKIEDATNELSDELHGKRKGAKP